MHHYHSPMPNWSPWWLVMVWCAIIVIIGGSLHHGSLHHEPGVRHALPDPHVPQCYAIIEFGGGFCQFRL